MLGLFAKAEHGHSRCAARKHREINQWKGAREPRPAADQDDRRDAIIAQGSLDVGRAPSIIAATPCKLILGRGQQSLITGDCVRRPDCFLHDGQQLRRGLRAKGVEKRPAGAGRGYQMDPRRRHAPYWLRNWAKL